MGFLHITKEKLFRMGFIHITKENFFAWVSYLSFGTEDGLFPRVSAASRGS